MKKVKLEDVCYRSSSSISQKDIMVLEGKYPIYGASGLIKNINYYKYEKEYIGVVKDGAGIGRTMILPAKSSVISTIQYILPKENINIRYLYYALNFMNLSKYYSGVTIPHIYFKDYKYEELFLPNKSEQQKIVSKLDKIQEIIDNRKKQIELLDELIKSQFVEMFKNNKKMKLCDIASITMGQSPDSASYNDNEDGVPFFQGKADYGEKYTVVRQWTNKPSKLANKGDVLMSVRAPVGPVNISSCDCCIGRGLCAISAKDGITNNEFIYNALNAIQDEILLMGTGSTFKAITKNEVFNIEIPFASIELQNKFAEFVKQIDKQKFKIQRSLEETQKLQESLMNKYFG